ncbi:MAG: glycosyltransferase family 2 protein [Candidatus Omnitrophica bacterium]|nr:glycosyltransferase family 2 protein [Candidatus Omnitrophota bacterium]
MDKISAIIVTWNAEKFLAKCLDSVFSQSIAPFEVFVVDNGSTDKTIEIIKKTFPEVLLIENKQNKGFCTANNQAINKAKADYILTLNSDIVLEPDYISKLLNYLKIDKSVGMVQGKFLRMDKKTIDCLGLKLGLFFRLFNIAEGKKDSTDFKATFEIFGPCAAAAVYRKELISDIIYEDEVFDPKFFFLVEDFDLAWRARNQGWKAMCVLRAVCYHYRDSSAHSTPFKQYLSFRNRYFLLIKNGNWKHLLLFIPGFFIYDLPRFVFMLFTNPFTLKAIVEVVYSLPELIRKRD